MLSQNLLIWLEFIRRVQRERNLIALYLSSKGKSGTEDLERQFALTDRSCANIEDAALAPDAKPESLFRFLQSLPLRRQHIIAQFVKPLDAIDTYSREIIRPAINFVLHTILYDTNNAPIRVCALTYLLQLHECLCLERDIKKLLETPEWENSGLYLMRLERIAHDRQAFEHMFTGLAEEKQKQPLAETNAENKHHALETLIKDLAEQLHPTHTAIIHDLALDKDIESHFDLMRTLPVFAGINPPVLRSVLRNSRLAHVEKGGIFLVQGEPITRFYIILDGWVKIFKDTAEGEESILHVLGKNECLLDVDILNPGISPISAKTATKAKILSIPATSIRAHITQHKELALNVLKASTQRSQKLFNQFKQLTLLSAEQRVGLFFLNLYLETKKDSLRFNLPFDKSLISSTLNIKPETFSRILQSFRNKGFRIERNIIILPNAHALCEFCDPDTVITCPHATTIGCPRTEQARK